jgi:ATP-binding cassette subfamily B multidrug efflux pump
MTMRRAIYGRFERLIDPFRTYDETLPPTGLVAFVGRYVRQVWGVLLAVLVVGFFSTVAEVLVFRYIADIIDILTHTRPAELWQRHGRDFVVMMVVLGLVWPVLIFVHSLLLRQAVSNNLPTLVRWQTHRHVIRQSLAFFTNDYAGRVASKIVDTASAVRSTLVTLCDTFLYVLIYVSSALYLFVTADFRLVVPLALWMAAYGAACVFFVPRLGKSAHHASEMRSTLMGRVVDSYTNIMTVKLFANTRHEDDYVRGALTVNNDAWKTQQRLVTDLEMVIAGLNTFLLIGTGALAVWLWSRGAISVGAIALVGALTQRMINMSGWIMFQMTSLFENIGSIHNGIDTISKPHTVVDTPDAPVLTVPKGEIRFDNVTFGYGEAAPAISGFTLTIRPGEKIGLVGPSGAGKSTIVNLFLRLYDLKDGQIRIDGQDIAEVNQESLRAHIGMVTQDTSLLHRSIRDNIAYGLPKASDAEIERAAERAHAAGFIPALNDGKGRTGYDAQVGERGVKLSGGQRQRIAIARVLLKNAPILVLDEATSALDSEVEAAIQESLMELMTGKTVIAIAHRLSTIARMDRLVVMEAGRIIEVGSHAELIAAKGLYARLWARQTGGFISEDA